MCRVRGQEQSALLVLYHAGIHANMAGILSSNIIKEESPFYSFFFLRKRKQRKNSALETGKIRTDTLSSRHGVFQLFVFSLSFVLGLTANR